MVLHAADSPFLSEHADRSGRRKERGIFASQLTDFSLGKGKRRAMSEILSHVEFAKFPMCGDLVHLFVGGSELHGAKVHGTDDLDIYGVYLEPSERILGLELFEHFVWSTAAQGERNGPADIDITLYSLRKLAGLLCKGNPTALNFLFSFNAFVGEDVKRALFWGELSAQLKKHVISKSASKQFMGFVDAQMGRLLGTRGRGKKGQRPELEEKFGYDVKAGMHAIRLLHECIELMFRHTITFPRPEKELLIEVRTGGWSLDKLSTEVNRLFVELKDQRERSSLPENPNRQAVSRLISDAYLAHWRKP